MLTYIRPIGWLVLLAILSGCATSNPPGMPAYGAVGTPQEFEGMGTHARTVTTDSSEARAWFNQGLAWLYSFNHDEAVRAFTRATELDPGCAMAWWGISYAQGPNYNDPMMSAARNEAAWTALRRALAEIDDETPAERALIEALSHRYANPAPEDRTDLNIAFADAMATVWEQFPNDSDIGTLYAESMMVQHPWKLYTCDMEPAREQTNTIVATLERVLKLDPYHPGANHLYIHAVEPSADKDRAIVAANRLSDLVPGSGHMLHMPSHIYVQTGMWERSIEQNARAMERDDDYRVLAPEQGIQHMYMTHNSHMLAFSAMMIGREKEALHAAQQQWADLSEEELRFGAPFIDTWMCSKYDVLKRFGRWDQLLAEPAPPDYLPVTNAVWHAHRAIAYAAKKDFDNARREHRAFRKAKTEVPQGPIPDIYETTMDFLAVSDLFIEGEIALQQQRWDEAASLLERAAKIEDELGYGEPPLWLQPVRHTLGAVYMKAGKYAQAERVYREDLVKWRANGWSLYGLARALEEQGRLDEARTVRDEYQRVWAQADEPTTTSCKCLPET